MKCTRHAGRENDVIDVGVEHGGRMAMERWRGEHGGNAAQWLWVRLQGMEEHGLAEDLGWV